MSSKGNGRSRGGQRVNAHRRAEKQVLRCPPVAIEENLLKRLQIRYFGVAWAPGEPDPTNQRHITRIHVNTEGSDKVPTVLNVMAPHRRHHEVHVNCAKVNYSMLLTEEVHGVTPDTDLFVVLTPHEDAPLLSFNGGFTFRFGVNRHALILPLERPTEEAPEAITAALVRLRDQKIVDEAIKVTDKTIADAVIRVTQADEGTLVQYTCETRKPSHDGSGITLVPQG